MPRNGRFLGRFFGFDLGLFAPKTSLFFASKKANSFVCNRWLGLFPQKSIFFHFLPFFPFRRLDFQVLSRAPLAGAAVRQLR
jgi:hypothetical protein